MKIAFPLISEIELADDFTNSSFVGVYDVDDDKLNLISLSSQTPSSSSGFIFETLKHLEAKSVVSPFYSFMALRVFKENNFNTLKAINTNLEDNIIHFKSGGLQPFNAVDAFFANQNCKNGCLSCESQCLKK